MLKSMSGKTAKQEKIEMPLTEAEKAAAAEAQKAEVQKAATAIVAKVFAMNDVTKAHYLALGADEQTAFLEKSTEEQAKIAAEAKEAADRKKAEEEAAKTGKSVREMELEKRLDDQKAEIEAMKAREADREIEKRAETEFSGYPGGVAAVVPLLKAYAKLPQAEREASELVLKAHAQAAKSTMHTFAGRTEADLSKAASAQAKIEKAAKELAEAKKINYADAWEKVIEDPAYAEDVAALV